MVFDSRAVRLRIPQDTPRIRLDELLTFTGLILWVLQAYIDDSGFGLIFGSELGKLIRYFCLLLFLVRILLSDMRLAVRAVSTAAVFFCYLMMIQKMAGAGITFLQLFVMMMAVKDIDFKRICKVMFWTCLLSYLTILFFDKIGVIYRPPLVDGSRVRDYMGFRFVSFPAIYLFNLIFCGAYAYTDLQETAEKKAGRGEHIERFPWLGFVFLEGLNFIVYKRTNTNIPFLITSLFILLYVVCIYLGWNLFPNNLLMRCLAGICYPGLAFFAYEVVRHYNPNSTQWLKMDDKLTHFRIRHSAEGLKTYGIHPFGQIVYQNGDLESPNYFYIDSAYMKVLINYGLIFAIILFGIYAMISVAAVKNRDTVLCIWMVCIAGYSLMNNVLMDPEQCCSLFAFWYALDIWKRRRTPDYYLPEPDRPFTGRGGGGGGPVNVVAGQNDPEQEASRSEIINDRSAQDPASPETESTGEAAGKSAGGGDGSKKNSSLSGPGCHPAHDHRSLRCEGPGCGQEWYLQLYSFLSDLFLHVRGIGYRFLWFP